MSKTLTEQWREGKLPDGAYYIIVDKYEQNEPEMDVGICYNSNFEWWIVKEVISPVPSYDEYKELTQKVGRLELENEVLDDVVQECNKRGLENKKLREQVKELEGYRRKTQQQLDDANKLLQYECSGFMDVKFYLKKWGVK